MNYHFKIHDARILTLEDLDMIYNIDEHHIWPYNTPPYLWMTINPNIRSVEGFWVCWRDVMYSIENKSPFYIRDNYESTWVVWSSIPTREQVIEIKWK